MSKDMTVPCQEYILFFCQGSTSSAHNNGGARRGGARMDGHFSTTSAEDGHFFLHFSTTVVDQIVKLSESNSTGRLF